MTRNTKDDVDVQKPYNDAPEHIQKIVKEVLVLEKERLYQLRPRVNSEVIQIIKEHTP